MTNEEFQRSKSFEENLKEWNLLSRKRQILRLG